MSEEALKWLDIILSKMGSSSESGLSSWGSSSQEMENLNLSDFGQVFVPETNPYHDSLIQNRANYLQQVAKNIIQRREFQRQNLVKIDAAISKAFNRIYYVLKMKEKYLKTKLQEIGNANALEWDRQLSACRNGYERLKTSSTYSNFETAYNDVYLKDIDVIESGDVQLDFDESKVIEALENVGNVFSSKAVVPKFVVGSTGNKVGEFCRPWGVCTDETGRILVSDRSNHRVQIFNETGEFLLKFGQEGSKWGEFNRPAGIAADRLCRVIVADKDNHRIQIFSYSGKFLLGFGGQGSEPGNFNYPWDVAVNRSNEIAVSDTKNNRIQLFTHEGTFLTYFDYTKLGVSDRRLGLRQLDCPRGLAFRPDGWLMVTDFNNHRLVVIDSTFTKRTLIGREGSKPGEFFRPQGVACDNLGRFAISDCKNHRIQVFDCNQTLLKVFGFKGDGPGEFNCPQGIAFHPNGSIVIVDLENNRIQIV